MRFVVEVTESASHGTPLTADTLRRFSSAAMPYGDLVLRGHNGLKSRGRKGNLLASRLHPGTFAVSQNVSRDMWRRTENLQSTANL